MNLKAQYLPKNIMSFILAGACVEVALDNSEKAEMYLDEVKKAWGLPDCQKALSEIQIYGSDLLDVISNKDAKIINTLGEIYEKHKEKDDCRYLREKINEFIKAVFNREIEKNQGIYKVIPENTPWLCAAIGFSALGRYFESTPDYEEARLIHYKGKTYDPVEIMEGATKDRVHRWQVKQYKNIDWSLHQNAKLNNIVYCWYQSRVVYDGPKEFSDKHLLETGIELIPSNVTKDIKLCDIAMGYPRKYLENPYI